MASRATAERWLHELTHTPTAPGMEHRVAEWVGRWVDRRDDLRLAVDTGGNLLITQKGRKAKAPVIAVAHMDHPAFVLTEVQGRVASFEFRGGVSAPYFHGARVGVISRHDGPSGKVTTYDPVSQTGTIDFGSESAQVGDIALWRFPKTRKVEGRFQAPACDDLAGAAAALAALDRMRGRPGLRHFGVLLTRAEEVGLIGAIHVAKHQTIPPDSRVLSIETSRELPEAPIGDGPIIRTGDRSTVFDRELLNRISRAVESGGLRHQRKLMSGGGCEATAFGVYGYQAAGLCLALGNWHNRGNLDEVEAGRGEAVPMLEEISVDDFHGLIDLLVIAAGAVDVEDPVRASLDRLYESRANLLS